MKRISGLSCLAAVATFTGCSTTPPPPTVEENFRKADANGDGVVTRDEYTRFLVADMFVRYDANKDSVITKEEYLAKGGTEEGFRKINASGSGSITLAEAQASPAVRKALGAPFEEADTSGNGKVTLEEFRAARAKALDYVR
jgi:Ca2+-binding EF-hand superfamily protein